jgi:hypothetical protein
MANNIIDFAVAFSVIVATIMFAYGGVLYVTGAAGGEAQIKKAHKVLLNAILGILIVLLAWLLVNIVVSVLTNNGVDFWVNQFSCSAIPSTVDNQVAGQTAAQNNSSLVPTFPGTKAQSLASAADQNTEPSSTGACALYVRQDLIAAGYTQFAVVGNYPPYASEYATDGYLSNAGFATVPQSGYVPQAGDVVVFQPVTNHPYGHIEVYNGSGWDSDYNQGNNMYPTSAYQGGQYTVYRPTG